MIVTLLPILLNLAVILSTAAAQLQLPAASSVSQAPLQLPPPPPPPSPPLIEQPQIIPTKPPLVQLTRTTAAANSANLHDSAPSTPSFAPASPVITIDVSQPATPSTTQAPAPKLSTAKFQLEPEEEAALESASVTPQPGMLANITQPLESSASQLRSQNKALVVSSTTTQRPLENAFSTLASLVSPSTPAPTPTTPAPAPTQPQLNKPQQQTPTRIPESRRIPDGPVSTTSANSSSSAVQFLKPKSKFRCTSSNDCSNGMCFNGSCFCSPGFSGEACSINIDECRQTEEPCHNGGVCIDEVNQYRCECSPGFKGDSCQESVDMCVGSPCLNGAKCLNHRIDYSCECEAGWEGRHCEKNIDECLKNPCQNNGTCYDLINDYRCECGSSGFTGKNCEIDFDDCAAKPCSFFAKECVDLTGDFKCICHEGFTGKTCDVDIDECQTNPCENSGTCKQKSENLPHLHNSTDLTIYHELRDQNLSSGINVSQYAGFTCDCKEEYYGDRCEERKKCYTRSISELCNNRQAECLNVGSSYECLINASFDGSGRNYANYRVIGEFKMREIYVKYRSLTGGIIMSFETTQPDSPVADLQLNKSGLYLSGAPIKRDENIKFDELLDGNEREIRLELDTPTEIKSISLTRQNSIISDYHSPFKGCLMQVRLNNQLVPHVDYGYYMNHSFEVIDNHLEVGQCRTCFEKDCSNHGHCEFQEGYDHCTCPDAFTGNFCEIDVNECEKNFGLCLNGGSCENLHGGYKCNCKEGYRGEKCQEISDYCKAKQPCVTGTCKNVNHPQGTYQCECPSSHIGKRCDRKRDCLNECHTLNSQCINNVTCACLPGRREERIMCEYVASCEQIEGELCLNGGTCKNLETGGYQCVCQEPFYGPICQFLVEKPQFDAILLIIVTCVGFLTAACAVVSLVIFRSVRKARATRGTYSPSTQEKFGNSASDLLKPPQPERLI